MLFSIYLVAMEYFEIQSGILRSHTNENGFYELGSGFLLFFFGIYLFFKAREFTSKRVKYAIYFTGIVLILGALEELSWGQHIFKFESIEFFSQHNNQHEMNLHNFVKASFFGLFINLSFYLFFVFIPIFFYFYKEKLLNTRLSKYSSYINYLPPLELVLVFCFAFSMQKYFILDTYADTIALVVALILLAIIAKNKRDVLFSFHLLVLVFVTSFFMYAHNVFNYQNLQYEIREFIFIYAMLFWFYSNIKLLQKA